MANIDISSKLSHEPQTITIAEGKTYEVDCGAEMMLKAQDLFKKDDSLDARLAYQEKPLFFHSNREINLSFSIKNITHDYAEIEFYEINA